MNLKNKTDKELWDMLDKIKIANTGWAVRRSKTNLLKVKRKHKIYREIIRREKDEG